MRAITVHPGVPQSARLDEVDDPAIPPDALGVRAWALGVCGTDREIVRGEYGAAPQGAERLILGHESLGIVEQAPPRCGFAPGDRVVGIVRQPDPVPCPCCAAGEWDMCRNGQYTEHGIKELHGFGAERYALHPAFAVKVDPGLGLLAVLLEPTTVVAKAWDHIEAITRRARSTANARLLVTGAGPVGLLAALLGLQRGLEVHVFDRAEGGPKPALVAALGGTYHRGDIGDVLRKLQPDVLIECTAAVPVIAAALGGVGPNGIVCTAGVSPSGRNVELDLGAVNRAIVLGNQVVFGSVNANRTHYEAAAEALARADKAWLAGLISRRVPLERWAEALDNRPDDIKVVIDFTL